MVQYRVVVENEDFAYLALNPRSVILCDLGQMTNYLKFNFICMRITLSTLSGLREIRYIKKGSAG